MTETIPFEFPGYRLESMVGQGGMGRVFRAEQLATHRTVAIKILDRGTTDPARLAVFHREAATVAKLEHPHVVPLYDYGDHQGTQYLVFRFLTGGTVADRIKEGPIEAATALRWIDDVASALDAAHQRGIIHRDVKPSNLLLDESGNVYLGDFGIAAAMVDLEGSAQGGSAAYASPEQGRGKSVDAASDVYSLSVTAFEMMTGSKPFQAETALGMMVRHMHDPVPSARALQPTLPPAVDSVLAAGMAKDPRERPTTPVEFARRLRQAMSASPAATLVPQAVSVPGVRTGRGVSRTLLVGIAAAAGLVCLLGVGVFGGGLAAILSSPTPTIAIQPSPTASINTSVPVETLPFTDDFSNPASGFGLKQAADGRVEYADGTLRITSLLGGREWFLPYAGLSEQDLQIAVQARRLEGPLLSEMAVVCRWQNEANFVAAAWRNDGQVSLWRETGGVEDRWVGWTAVPRQQNAEGEWRSLQLTCQGPTIRFAVDGTDVAEAVDPSPASGSIALMAGLLEPGKMVVAFDNLRVSHP